MTSSRAPFSPMYFWTTQVQKHSKTRKIRQHKADKLHSHTSTAAQQWYFTSDKQLQFKFNSVHTLPF